MLNTNVNYFSLCDCVNVCTKCCRASHTTKAFIKVISYWPAIDCDLEVLVKFCRGCALAVKSPLLWFQPCPKTNSPRTRLHTDFAWPVNDAYYLIVVGSYSKWMEICRYRKPISTVRIEFLHEHFARYSVLDIIVSNNGTQFMVHKF